MHSVLIGTSGFSYKHWKEIFYPEGLAPTKWLSFYAQHFTTVEINATFYRFFNLTVFESWYDRTPEDFKFVLKGPKSITRDKRLQDVDEELDRFFASAVGLKDKLSLVLWQLPPSFKNDSETFTRVQEFLSKLPAGIRYAVEFRHASWCTEEVYALFNRLGVGWVSADSSRFISILKATGGFAYFRFHGPGKLYASSYSSEALQVWAKEIQNYRKNGDVYCYFNNDFYGYALTNGGLLRELLVGETE